MPAQAKVVAIIQARMGSTRLPGKILMDVGGKTALERVLRRLDRAAELQQIVVATTVLPGDDAVVSACERLGVRSFRGAEEDVLDRYYKAAQTFGAEAIARITSDCPLIDPELVDETVRSFAQNRADYASNALERSYPRGLDTEVFSMQALETAWTRASQPHEREHVTPYIYENPRRFRLISVRNPMDYSRYRWTLDTQEDLNLIRTLYSRFGDSDAFTWKDAIEVMEREPALAALNSHVKQKALHPAG